jgi:hypothetical protein
MSAMPQYSHVTAVPLFRELERAKSHRYKGPDAHTRVHKTSPLTYLPQNEIH